jgi:hypothetical protein
MIINVRGCTNRSGIIISHLVKNEEGTGYSSFASKKLAIKNKTDILAAIKKTLILTRKIPVIKADAFVSTIDKVSRKTMCDTSAKLIVKTINEENMRSRMLSLSYIHFNNKPLPQVKAINIVNGNMYFMIKKGPDYILELIENEKIECMISISSLVNLYRMIKQRKDIKPKNFFKSMYITRDVPTPSNTSTESIRNIWRTEHTSVSNAEHTLLETAEPIEESREEELEPVSVDSSWLTYDFNGGDIVELPTPRPTERRPTERRPTRRREVERQIGRIAERAETLQERPVITPEMRQEIIETMQEERPTEREQPNQARMSNQNRHDESEEEGLVIRPTPPEGTSPEGTSPRSAFIDYLREHENAFNIGTAYTLTMPENN